MRSPGQLFRLEALTHVGNRSHGVVLLARPTSYSAVTFVFSVVAIAIVAFLAFGHYTRKVTVSGSLQPTGGLLKIMPAQSGVISESRIREGQTVNEGDVLFVLSNERQTTLQGNAEQTISDLLKARRKSLEQEKMQLVIQYSQRMSAANDRVNDLIAESSRIDAQIALQIRRVEMAATLLKRFGDLAASNFVSSMQVQDKQAELLDQEQRLAELKRVGAANARELAKSKADIQDLQVQANRDREASERSVSATEQDLTENEARRQIFLRAPSGGTLTAITAEAGKTVAAGQALASILPVGSELEAELYAPSRAVGFIKVGMEVQLRYQAYSFQKFGQAKGRVREISRASVRPQELDSAGASSGNEPVYIVRVALDRQSVFAYGVEQPLRSGAILESSIALEKRRLYEWVFEPLYTISGRI